VERTDLLNAAALAAVLLFMGFIILSLFGWLSRTVDTGIFNAQGREDPVGLDAAIDPQSALLRPPNEVSVRVGNGSEGRQGLAGRATRKLDGLGYGTLEPKNKEGEPTDDSQVYYVDGFTVDAIQIAGLLSIPETQVRPLLGDPGLPTEGADVIVVLGQNADF
jgi:hypothetical protein